VQSIAVVSTSEASHALVEIGHVRRFGWHVPGAVRAPNPAQRSFTAFSQDGLFWRVSCLSFVSLIDFCFIRGTDMMLVLTRAMNFGLPSESWLFFGLSRRVLVI